MKNWVITIALVPALAAGPGCQTAPATGPGPATSEAAQAVEDCFGAANFCQAPKVTITSWTTGDPFPQSSPSTVVVFMRTSSSLWQAYGADPASGIVQWGVQLKGNVVGSFLNLADGKSLKYGGVRPPPTGTCPPECGHPLVGYLLEAALRIAPISDQALAAENACKL